MLTRRILGMGATIMVLALLCMPMAALAATGDGSSVVSGQVADTPTVTSISPDHGSNGDVSVTITGTNFVAGESHAVTISGNGVTASSIVATSDTTIDAVFTITPDATPGARAVSVTIGGKTGTHMDAFAVDAYITVSPPESIDIGLMSTGTPNNGSEALTDLVSTNAAIWSILVSDTKGSNTGTMTCGATPLSEKLRIGRSADVMLDADVGISYTQADGLSPTLHYSQNVLASDQPGIYQITLTFAGSVP